MFTPKELKDLKKVDPLAVNLDDLIDINDVEIQMQLPREERIADFIRQIKNPYLFKCGNVVVKIEFSQAEVTLTERMKQYMRLK
ncbi:MAG TPA: hypothetical protein DDW34_05460 [Clostridium sp.]|jgi:hypothetical protein|uniref:DUF6870 domain-containing protein n=1 Tax=Anaerotignum propionicum DSM 1682 TaxID=991789 RepID=A0A0X8VB35_ANAPI|nr:hypothetical protein [Anaerotignum propionicum]AMJ41730.1 hypothetical protein CPRO_21500 [Anaerotignum propionicum DSM 1682]SHE83353.1 hypothetical protein SAMN02745151_01926 [[Clostridium] propionicum DSM 1682] [Anaerotignum propionicum DSM 1682]HBF65283.1 hypothetical protein [Clostridium sp.]